MAIQALWTGGAESLQMTFLGQAAVLGQFQHPNILRLEGVVTKSRPLMVLTELMELGPLDSFLRVSRAWRLRGAGGLCRESGPFSAVPETELSAFGPSCPTSRGLHPSFPGCSDPQSTPPPPRHLAPVCALLCVRVLQPLPTSVPCPSAAGGPVQQPATGGHAAWSGRRHAVPVQLCLRPPRALCPQRAGKQPPGVQSGASWPHSSGESAALGPHIPRPELEPGVGGYPRWCILVSEGAEVTCVMEGFQGPRTVGPRGWETI